MSQEIPASIRQQIEAFIEDQETEDIDIYELYEKLGNYYNKPFNINSRDFETLKELRLLSDFQLQDLNNHIDQYGELIAIEELQSISSFDMETIKRILPFVSVQGTGSYHVPLKQLLYKGRHEIYLKYRRILEQQAGYEGDEFGFPKYAGDQNRLFLKYKYNYESRFRYGFTMEKDAGEDFFTGSNPQGFDFMSAYIYAKDYSKKLKDIVVGDYTISMGQGLIANNAFGSGKSAWVTDIKKGGRVIKPYNSVSENAFFRGGAVTLTPINHFECTLFGSYVKKDGNSFIDTSDVENISNGFSSLLTSGYHRTAAEIEDEKAITQFSAGTVLKYKKRNFYAAFNFLHQSFDSNFDRADQLYNRFVFEGDQLQNLSIDYSYRVRNLHFFGESAMSYGNKAMSHLHGLLLGLGKKAGLALLYRDYAKDYHVLEPNAFGESASNINESGYYLGLELYPAPRWKIRMYTDVWKNEWLKFLIDRPGTGREYLLRVDYFKKRRFSAYTQFFYEHKIKNYSTELNKIDAADFTKRYRIRLHVNNQISKAVELRSRVEYANYSDPDELSQGILLFQDIIYKPLASPFSFTARYAIFDIDDFDSRIYTYENDILYEFFIPSFSGGAGTRYYINTRCDVTRNITAELRFSRTYFADAFAISTGNELIFGDTKSEVKAQLRFKF